MADSLTTCGICGNFGNESLIVQIIAPGPHRTGVSIPEFVRHRLARAFSPDA